MPNGKHLPLQLLPKQARGRKIGSSVFAFKDNLTMVSWHPKRSKFVLLLSSLHHNSNIVESGKPEIVEFYNKTKAGVDALDQKVRYNTTYRKTYRWPLAAFTTSLTYLHIMLSCCSSCDLLLKVKLMLSVPVSSFYAYLVNSC